MRVFSRISVDTKLEDINKGIENVINILWNELKYKITLKKELGNLPLTKCNIGQLNQVFMNLLINATESIENHGEILIKTSFEEDNIVVFISDTGCGIPPEIVSKIFEAFFTTKEIGKGTGLGLSISYEIIKKHNGSISVISVLGKGTSFTVRIPIVLK